jgi:hypothetical protein
MLNHAGMEVCVEKSREDGRVFIAVNGLQVEFHSDDTGVSVQITKGNQVLAECSADYDG